MNATEGMLVLRPVFELGQVGRWNATSQIKLAAAIGDRDARDMTLRELLRLMDEVLA